MLNTQYTQYTSIQGHSKIAAAFLRAQESDRHTGSKSENLPLNPPLDGLVATAKAWLSVQQHLTTPLHLAVRTNNSVQFGILLKSPLQTQYITTCDSFGNTALH